MKHRIPAAHEPASAEYVRVLDEIDRLAGKLDTAFQVPLTTVRFGWDPVIGLVPIAGDLVALALSMRIIAAARTLGASPQTVRRMATYAAIDALFGLVPVAGTVFDVFFRANVKNVDLLMEEIRQHRAKGRP